MSIVTVQFLLTTVIYIYSLYSLRERCMLSLGHIMAAGIAVFVPTVSHSAKRATVTVYTTMIRYRELQICRTLAMYSTCCGMFIPVGSQHQCDAAVTYGA